jgi:hypothetical protein
MQQALVLALLGLLCGLASFSAKAAEWVTLSPDNFAEFAPPGKEAEAVWGDYVIRNDRVVAAVADATMIAGRSAGRWAITSVAGAVIDFTRRDHPNDMLSAYYPAKARFKPDAPEAQALFTDDSTLWQAPGRAGEKGKEVVLTPSPTCAARPDPGLKSATPWRMVRSFC